MGATTVPFATTEVKESTWSVRLVPDYGENKPLFFGWVLGLTGVFKRFPPHFRSGFAIPSPLFFIWGLIWCLSNTHYEIMISLLEKPQITPQIFPKSWCGNFVTTPIPFLLVGYLHAAAVARTSHCGSQFWPQPRSGAAAS